MFLGIPLSIIVRLAAIGIIAALIALQLIPAVNTIARSKGLLNEPGERTSHRYKTPNFGGISIFIAATTTSLFFLSGESMFVFKFVFLGGLIVFFTGLKDDIVVISAEKKLLAEILAAGVVVFSDLRFTSFFGLFGIFEISDITSFAFTIFFIILMMNAFNLIDGIDGLAAILGTLILSAYSMFFLYNGFIDWAILCTCFIAPILVFFQFNVFGLRNKTFLGDSGSLLMGLIIAVSTIQFCESNLYTLPWQLPDAAAIALSILIIPVFDTARVFFYRIIHRRSPFSPDRNHLHHRLIDLGLRHLQASLILGGLNVVLIAITLALAPYAGVLVLSCVLVVLMTFFTIAISLLLKRKQKQLRLQKS